MNLIRKLLFCFLFATILFPVFSQNQGKADSLLILYESDYFGSTEEKLNTLFWLSAYSSSPSKELQYGNELLSIANQYGNKEYISRANLRIGVANRLLGNLSSAFQALFKAASIAAEEAELSSLLAQIYNEISTCYTLSNEPEKALDYGLKTSEILRLNDETQELAISFLNIAYDYYLLGDFENARKYNSNSRELFDEIKLEIGQLYAQGNNALIHWKSGNRKLAIKILEKVIDQLEIFEDSYAITDYQNKLAEVYLEEGNSRKALSIVSESLKRSKSEGLKEQLRDGNLIAYTIYKKQQDFEQSLAYLADYHAYKDSIYNQETADLLANIHSEFELAQKQAEVNLLVAERKNNRLVIAGAAILVFSLILISLIILRFYKSKVRLNQQLQDQRSELIDLNDTKDKFFSIISHDLRGPIGVVSGLASTIKKDMDTLSNDDLKEMINHVDHSANNLVKLLDNLLHWSLQQRGSLPYVPEDIDAEAACKEIINLFGEMASGKAIKMSLEAEMQVQLYVDKNGLNTIIRNLINNAIKFSNKNSEIKMVIGNEKDMGSISVIDQGIGMSKDQIENLLDSKIKSSTKGTSGEKGMGIGLQLVKEFTQINKGTMEVHSTPGEGTTFKLLFPIAKA